MAKPELGTKRQCASCGSKYYDLNKDPIVCPKCGTVFEVIAVAHMAPEEDTEHDPAAVELVSLDEVAKAEKGKAGDPLDDDLDVDDDVDDADTFLEEEEEANGDVSDLIDNDLGEDDDN